MNDSKITWQSTVFSRTYHLYHDLVSLLVKHLDISEHLISNLSTTEIDEFSNCIVHIYSKANRLFALIKKLLLTEMSNNLNSPNTGGNVIAKKLAGIYVRGIGKEYLRAMLSDLVTEIATNESLDLEIQANKLSENIYRPENSEIQQQIEVNREALMKTAKIFIDRIVDPNSVRNIPSDLRKIVSFASQLTEKYAPDKRSSIISGFVIQRFISPAIVTPEAYEIVPMELIPSQKARRNLVLLAKLIQNCGTGTLYGAKENYMTYLNPFIVENSPRLTNFFNEIAENNIIIDLKEEPLESLDNNDIHINTSDFDFSYLLDLHLLIDHTKSRMIPFIEQANDIPNRESILELINNLGVPPYVPVPGQKRNPLWRGIQAKSIFSTEQPECSSVHESKPEESISIATASLQKAGFLYLGPNTRSGLPVIYVIVNRFREQYLSNVDLLITYLYELLKEIGNSRYVIVIDMSWAKIGDELKRQLYTQIKQISTIVERRIRKNLEKVYIVHPSAYTRAVMLFMRSFTSGKLKTKIVEIYNWESLQSDISKADILLPDSSKHFITKTYSVVKVNAKGKNQKRLIKFTSDSILNVDPKTKKIQNEKKLNQFKEFTTFNDNNEVQIRFSSSAPIANLQPGNTLQVPTSPTASASPNSQNKSKPLPISRSLSSSMLSFKFKSGEENLLRRYIFDSTDERNQMILDIFKISFFSATCNYPQEYRVTKVNKRGRHQERIFKLTCDSLLNLDSSTIKSEISFAGIDSVSIDSEKNNILWLQFKAETKQRKIICKDLDAVQLMGALKEGMERYKQDDKLEEERGLIYSSRDY